MQHRISQSSLYKQCPRLVTHLTALGDVPESAKLSPQLLHLVKLRASQLNHCGFCQKMHADEARADGEVQSRLDVLPAWKELSCFTEKEQAALAWTEALTLINDVEIADNIFQAALDAFGEGELIELTAVIVQINSWNRIAVSFRFQPDIK
ncbi:carboxymuconolactone decarboxylase family protein [Idiomarina sp. M1R2S28]|uniref:Carboxymuconolactone decarboxylase family protein n=1 Tax=Idiomarina rhizosphaerae TaxID=2961572 RepID=A0A9X2G2X1_9GAMM|nr:carboxymuconolactone decarboxylase family protein [Idiomarina rhizosphaerae]MCP1338988.1 carboxymuconolactone decarboxylase family protein [Idiomarina rhizosphaerae]